jgi:hypothetical protein
MIRETRQADGDAITKLLIDAFSPSKYESILYQKIVSSGEDYLNWVVDNLARLIVFIAVFLAPPLISADSGPAPYRLKDNFAHVDWFTVGGHQRARFESLNGQFRTGRSEDVSILAFRTAVQADVELEGVTISAELMDSRQEGADEDTPLGTSIVNTFELIQGHAIFDIGSPGKNGQKAQLKVGRYTMDLGTRRFVARNRYRNTVNNFTGIHGSWIASSGEKVQLFYTLPVNRLPTDRGSLLNNRARIDDEDFDVQFWGAYIEAPELIGKISGDVFIFGLNEKDSSTLATRNRSIYTGGFRLFKSPQVSQVDFEFETALQLGESRASRSVTDTKDLDHFASFLHLEAGYTVDSAWGTRWAFQLDYSSGDKNPNDNENNRFDTLFGARRFDYGPTGTYGAFARSNLISPGYRITFDPREDVNVMLSHRFNWLASSNDAWTTGGLRDVTGSSGSYLGHQPEIRVRWDPLPGNLRLEVGLVHLFAGEFIENAPNANGQGEASYSYIQSIFTF